MMSEKSWEAIYQIPHLKCGEREWQEEKPNTNPPLKAHDLNQKIKNRFIIMHKVLFVCTANIFRSRFSEEVYNHFAKKLNIPSEAFSAGLRVGEYTTRKIYTPALQQLKYYNINPSRKDDLSIHINDLDLNVYDMIICMDEVEHRPMVEMNDQLNKIIDVIKSNY